ncbi:major facilitator superfamily transporter [Dactylonectria macrodidyma]|uniref:Major facilitator superfamily transporter n=1 Tax=Dactylonectria macrodidyma TaxID=307937 RepID=A0A9P9E1T8_9HYPO|nr:major facilitator superfamily transporter [Dactylonectria macrodidyma]
MQRPSASSRRDSLDLPGSVFLISGDGRILRLPMPSNSPSDPLSWSPAKRFIALGALVLYSVVALLNVQAASLMYKPLLKEFSNEITGGASLHLLVSAPSTLFLGLGALFWVPLSLVLGRRPVLLLSCFMSMVGALVAAIANKFMLLLVALCILGFAAGFAFSTGLLMTIDLTFIHERPMAIANYWGVGAATTLVALRIVPVLGATEWRNYYWFSLILSLACGILALFLVPETYFVRPAIAFDGRILVQDGSEKIKIYQDWDEVPGGKPLPDIPDSTSSTWKRIAQRLTIRKVGGDWKQMGTSYLQVLLWLCNPLAFWVSILNAINFGGMLSIGMTYPVILALPPYNLPESTIALVNPVAAVGAILAVPATCMTVSCVAFRLTRNNGGVRDAEHYLVGFLIPTVSGSASVVLYGVAVHFGWDFRFIFLSYVLNAFSSVGLGAAATLWVTEAFPRWTASALMVVGGFGYVLSFGVSYAIDPWVKTQGYLGANVQIGCLIAAVGGIALPLVFWGKNIRQYVHGKWATGEGGMLRPQV